METISMNDYEKYKDEIRLAILIRKIEEKLLDLYSQGKLFGTIHTCIGQEFVGVSVGKNIKSKDNIVSNHRCHGHFLSYKQNTRGLIGEIMGKSIGVCGGRGGSQHLHQDNFYSNGIQGGIVPVAAGLAYAQKLEKSGGLTVVFIGDGTLGEGLVYETMNIASKWKLPLLIVCENNLYAQSTSIKETLAGDIVDRARAFGINTAHSNTCDWINLVESMTNSFNEVRKTCKPFFHLVDTYRLMGHSKGDDIRSLDEIKEYKLNDPLNSIFSNKENIEEFQQIVHKIANEIDEAVIDAEKAPYSIIEVNDRSDKKLETIWKEFKFEDKRVVNSIRETFDEYLEKNHKLILIGEDIESPYGGAFKCTLGLSEKFQKRVKNTPISEAAILGIGNGLAIAGYNPVVEIMFGDFLTLAADQWINHSAKFKWMYNDLVNVPLIVRTPMGGNRGYGPTHSQSLEKHFVGLPGTRVLCLNHRILPVQIYSALFESNDIPTLVIENKILYGQYISSDPLPGYDLLYSDNLFPTVNLKPKSKADITVVALGGISMYAEDAVKELFDVDEIIVDLFMPTQLYPFYVQVFENSLSETRKLVVIEEGQGFASISSEIITRVVEKYSNFNIRCNRIYASETPIPVSRPLEDQCLPSTKIIASKIREFYVRSHQ